MILDPDNYEQPLSRALVWALAKDRPEKYHLKVTQGKTRLSNLKASADGGDTVTVACEVDTCFYLSSDDSEHNIRITEELAEDCAVTFVDGASMTLESWLGWSDIYASGFADSPAPTHFGDRLDAAVDKVKATIRPLAPGQQRNLVVGLYGHEGFSMFLPGCDDDAKGLAAAFGAIAETTDDPLTASIAASANKFYQAVLFKGRRRVDYRGLAFGRALSRNPDYEGTKDRAELVRQRIEGTLTSEQYQLISDWNEELHETHESVINPPPSSDFAERFGEAWYYLPDGWTLEIMADGTRNLKNDELGLSIECPTNHDDAKEWLHGAHAEKGPAIRVLGDLMTRALRLRDTHVDYKKSAMAMARAELTQEQRDSLPDRYCDLIWLRLCHPDGKNDGKELYQRVSHLLDYREEIDPIHYVKVEP